MLARPDPFELSSLIAWAERQPAGKTYVYIDTGKCFLCQYFSDHGFQYPTVTAGIVSAQARGTFDLPPGWDEIARLKPHTFGAAAERARRMDEQRAQ